MSGKALILTVSKDDSPAPAVASVERTCVGCGCTCWVSLTTLAAIEAKHGENYDVGCTMSTRQLRSGGESRRVASPGRGGRLPGGKLKRRVP